MIPPTAGLLERLGYIVDDLRRRFPAYIRPVIAGMFADPPVSLRRDGRSFEVLVGTRTVARFDELAPALVVASVAADSMSPSVPAAVADNAQAVVRLVRDLRRLKMRLRHEPHQVRREIISARIDGIRVRMDRHFRALAELGVEPDLIRLLAARSGEHGGARRRHGPCR